MSSTAAVAARLIVLVPAIAALLGLLAARTARSGRPDAALAARGIAVVSSILTLVFAIIQIVATGSRQVPQHIATLPDLHAGELRVPLDLQSTGPVAVIALAVAIVGLAVQFYTVWYLADDDRFAVFAATVSLFLAGMLLLVQSADLVLTLVGWEIMGWCSYLLIGHWSRREAPRRAAIKSFIVTRLADVGFVLGVVLLASGPGSTAYRSVLDYWNGGGGCPDAGACASPSQALLSTALSLLVIGVLGKSALFPFHDWLPDAMEGPTPASALIHAATMVAAGTFVLAQMFPILALSESARWLLATSAVISMLGAAIMAFAQTDLKRLLAYSTISQIAVMLSALAAAPRDEGAAPALLHLYAHAFFKALLFLAIGWLAVIAGGTTARQLRGSAIGHTVVRVGWVFGLVALAGVPITVGGVSKEHVVGAAEAGASNGSVRAELVYAALLLTVIVTSAYAMRAYLIVAFDEPRGRTDLVEERPPVSVPLSVQGVIVGLLALTVLGGLVTVTGVLDLHTDVSLLMILSTLVLVALGAFGAYVIAGGTSDPAERIFGKRMLLFDNGFGVDAMYRTVVAKPVVAVARLVSFLDTEVIDAYVRGGAASTRLASSLGVRAHARERTATGLVWVVAGVAALAAVGVVWR